MRKFLSSETINFKHPFTGDTALVRGSSHKRYIFFLIVLSEISCFQHVSATSLFPKRKYVAEFLLKRGASVDELNKEYVNDRLRRVR